MLGYVSRRDASVADLVGEPALRGFTALSQWHADGWGMAARDGAGLRMAKSPHRASDDPDYQRMTMEPLGDIGLVHLRWATPGLPVGDRNTHPFVRGDFALAHNGAIHPQDKLPDMLPSAWEQRLRGCTDSERYFLHIMSRLDPCGGDVAAAVADTVRHIRRCYTPNSLNAILLAPGALYAIAWHDPQRIPHEAIRARGSTEDPDYYFDLAYLVRADAVVVGSTGWPQDGWSVIPNGSVLIVDRATLATGPYPCDPGAPVVRRSLRPGPLRSGGPVARRVTRPRAARAWRPPCRPVTVRCGVRRGTRPRRPRGPVRRLVRRVRRVFRACR